MQTDASGLRPLHWAAARGQITTVASLLAEGALPDGMTDCADGISRGYIPR